MYVIINKSLTPYQFYAVDEMSGGHGYWSNTIQNAKFFTEYKEANDILISPDFTKENKMSNGFTNPPRMIHSALGLNNSKKEATGRISISKVKFVCDSERTISGKIK